MYEELGWLEAFMIDQYVGDADSFYNMEITSSKSRTIIYKSRN